MSESRHGGGASAARAEPANADPGNNDKAREPREVGPDPLVGRVINGRFKIVSVIARGGMGKVYKAEQAPLGRVCALKVLNPKYDGDRDPEFHKRFLLEASTAAKLTHSNTVTIFDYGQSDDIYFIAMEYIEGKTLHRVLRDMGTLAESRVAHIAAQICRSLREAHAMGVVHRDLKPGNILLSDKGDEHDFVKVLDFGLVKDVTGEAEDLTQAGLFMGSPKYMAPEQILGNEITSRTDIYSLGIMMYEMLCGKVPFDRGASVGTLMAHVNEQPPPMQATNPAAAVSADMDGIVKKCLAKNPDDRFASMKDLLEALKRAGGAALMMETQEGMPAVSTGRLSDVPSSARMPMFGASSSAHPAPVFASPSISDTLGTAPDKTEIVEIRPRNRRAALWFGLVAALGAGVFAYLYAHGRAVIDDAPKVAATGAPQAPTPAPSATEKAAAPVVRTVRVETEPPGASVSEGGVEICSSTPCEVVYKADAAAAEHQLKVTKKGLKPGKLTIAPGDEKVSTKLESFGGGGVVAPHGAGPKPPADYKPSPY